jgi:hypothetical protein
MVDRDARHDAEERFFGRPAAWTSTALGRFARPVLQHFSADGVQELVLSSDGARLSEPVLADLPSWLGELRDWEARRADRGRAGEKLRDDVTVLRMRRENLEPAASSSRWGREAPADMRRAA